MSPSYKIDALVGELCLTFISYGKAENHPAPRQKSQNQHKPPEHPLLPLAYSLAARKPKNRVAFMPRNPEGSTGGVVPNRGNVENMVNKMGKKIGSGPKA